MAESKDLIFSGNFTGQHNGADYDVSYQCSHDIDSTYEDDIRDYVEEMIPDKEYGGDSGYESFEMSTGFYDGEIEIEGTVTWESTMNAESFNAETAYSMIKYQDDDCLQQIADSLRPKYNLAFNEGELFWDFDMDTGDMVLYIYDGGNKKLDEITYDRKALTKALKEQGYKNPESWGAETFEAEDYDYGLGEYFEEDPESWAHWDKYKIRHKIVVAIKKMPTDKAWDYLTGLWEQDEDPELDDECVIHFQNKDLDAVLQNIIIERDYIQEPQGTGILNELSDKNYYKGAESFNAPTGYTERGPRPFYGNPRKMALDRWGNRRFIRRRKDGTYMKNVDVGRSLAMDRRRQSQTWAPAGYRDQGDGSPSLLVRLLDMFKGVDEEVLMAESYLMCADCDTYSSECGCHNSESDAYIYAYNDGHSDGRSTTVNYRPSATDRELTSFKKIFKQAEGENLTVNQQKLADAFEDYGYYDDSDPTIITGIEIADQKTFQKLLKVCQENDGIIDSSYPAEAYIIAIKCWQSIFQ
jgi:hypothetical protein